jgi:hypothetical protein
MELLEERRREDYNNNIRYTAEQYLQPKQSVLLDSEGFLNRLFHENGAHKVPLLRGLSYMGYEEGTVLDIPKVSAEDKIRILSQINGEQIVVILKGGVEFCQSFTMNS